MSVGSAVERRIKASHGDEGFRMRSSVSILGCVDKPLSSSQKMTRATARHVLRGLATVGLPCIHQHNAREAARRAHLDAFGADRGAPWRNPTNGGG